MATSVLIRLLTGITDRVAAKVERVLRGHPITSLVVSSFTLYLFMLPILFLVEKESWGMALFILFCGLASFNLAVLVVQIVKRHSDLAFSMVFATPVFALVAPLIIFVAILSAIFGPKFSLANFYLDVSVESTPPGRFTILLVDDLLGLGASALQHSSIYDNQETLDSIVEYVDQILQTTVRDRSSD